VNNTLILISQNFEFTNEISQFSVSNGEFFKRNERKVIETLMKQVI